MSRRSRLLRMSGLLLLLGVVVYAASWFNGFVWDDEEQVVKNPYITSFSYLPEVFSGSTFGGGGTTLPTGGYYKPLMSVWYMANYQVWGLGAGGFHFTQSLLHSINAIIVLWLMYGLLVKIGGKSKQYADIAAFGVALLWLLHPVNVESVSYVASAQEVLFTFFSLLSFLVVVYRQRLKLEQINALAISVVLLFLGLLSKESAAVMPIIIWCYLWWLEKDQKLKWYYAVLVVPVVFLYAFLRFGVAKVAVEPNITIPVGRLTLLERMVTVPETLWQHLRVTVMPIVLNIGHHQVVEQFTLVIVFQIAVVAGLSLVMILIAWWQKNKVAGLLWVWWVVSTLLVSNLYPLDMTFAERWVYFPLIGFLGFWAAVLLRTKIDWQRWGKPALVVFVMVVGLYLARTIWRQLDWQDGLTLYGKDLQHAQNAFDLENNYGVELFRVGDIETAREHFEKSIALQPDWWTHYNNLGVYYERQGENDKAIELYRKSADHGEYYLAWENLAKRLVEENDREAEEVLREGLRRFPNNQTLIGLELVRRLRGEED